MHSGVLDRHIRRAMMEGDAYLARLLQARIISEIARASCMRVPRPQPRLVCPLLSPFGGCRFALQGERETRAHAGEEEDRFQGWRSRSREGGFLCKPTRTHRRGKALLA